MSINWILENMKKKRHIALLLKKEKGNLKAAEQAKLDQLHLEKEAREEAKVFHWSKQYSGGFEPDIDAAWSRFQTKMEAKPSEAIVKPLFPNLLRIAAAVAVLIVAYIFIQPFGESETVAWMNIQTLDNEQRTVHLEDGTTVVLNENSSFQYLASFSDQDERKVFLSGEAYFEVAKDKEHPFIIESDFTKVVVLGTAFNVRAYPQEDFTEVEVVEGKVKFEAKDGSMVEVLTQQQRATLYTKTGEVNRKDKTSNAQAWHSNKLIFIDQSFRSILQDLERSYDVQIDASQLNILDCKFSLNIDIKEKQLEAILDDWTMTNAIQFKKNNAGKYIVVGGQCY